MDSPKNAFRQFYSFDFLRIKQRERIIGKISNDGEYQSGNQKKPYQRRFENFEFDGTPGRRDHKHSGEKISENKSVKRNHRVKAERGRKIAVKKRVKTARQTASGTGDARHFIKRTDRKKSSFRRIEKPNKRRAADGYQNSGGG